MASKSYIDDALASIDSQIADLERSRQILVRVASATPADAPEPKKRGRGKNKPKPGLPPSHVSEIV